MQRKAESLPEGAEAGSSCTCVMSPSIDPEEQLLCELLRLTLTTVEMDTSLCYKNTKAPQLGIEEFERFANEKDVATTKAHGPKEQVCATQHLAGIISSSLSSSDTTSDDDNPPPAIDAYTEVYYNRSGNNMGKGPARK